jgi:hypothetical protein
MFMTSDLYDVTSDFVIRDLNMIMYEIYVFFFETFIGIGNFLKCLLISTFRFNFITTRYPGDI